MGKIEIKQFRIIINGYLCRIFKRFCFVIINGKKIQFIQNTDGANFLIQQVIFPVIKGKSNFPQPFLFCNGLLELPVFRPNTLNGKFYFFPFGICRLDCGKNFHVFGINGLDGSFQIRFHMIFGFFNTFH